MKKKNIEINDEMRRIAEEAVTSVSRQVKFTIAEYPVLMYVDRFKNDTDDRYFVPLYQRNLAWNILQQSQFIESLIIGLPIPFMFFYQTDEGRMEIVDGSQRMRAMRSFIRGRMRLRDLILLPELNGFCFDDLTSDRKNKLEDITIRTIILDTDTDASTRAEMFARINRMGTVANEAEVRRGSLPGPVTELINELAKHPVFVEMTPFTKETVDKREREELITRFFAYLNRNNTPDGRFPGYRDRPRKFFYDYLKEVNLEAKDNPHIIQEMRDEFLNVLTFVKRAFPFGFRKSEKAKTVPRVRFEAIAIGSGLALRGSPNLNVNIEAIAEKMVRSDFDRLVVSDGANTRSKLEGRIDIVKQILEEE